MQRVQRLLRSVDRVQQRSRWLGFPLAVMGKFRDDHGGALTTVIAYNAFFAFFPLLLVVVTVLGFLLGRDSGFQQRLLGSAVADFPIIGNQVRDNIHGLRGSGVGLVIGLVAFAWGARGLTQVAQHAMAEIWNIPGRQRPGFWARQVRGLLLLVVFAVGLAATSLLTWLGSYGGKAVAVALANLVAAAAVNVGLFLLAFRVLTPRQIPTRQLVAGAAGRWGGLAGPAGRRWLPGRPLSASHQPGVRGVRDRPWPAVLVVSGRAAHLVRRRSQCCGRPAALAAKPAATTIGQHQRIRRSG
jgi:uncharacterized BrkB/YihY/UPF0761 family membrane protein